MTSITKIQLADEVVKIDNTTSILPLTAINKNKNHEHCILCGAQANYGLQLDFYKDQQGGVWTQLKGSINQQGYNGILHGGVSASLLDATMCNAIFSEGVEAVTADMSIRYHAEIPLTANMIVRAKIIKKALTLYKVEAEIYVEQKLMAKSSARFMKRQ